MRRFLVQAVIDGLIAAAIVFVLSLIRIAQPFPFGTGSAPISTGRQWRPELLVWGVVFALVNRVVRPALVALFGRWLFSTLGLFVLVAAFMLWLASRFASRGRGGRRPAAPLDPAGRGALSSPTSSRTSSWG